MLREALRTGKITFTKALLVAKTATPETVKAEIEKVKSTTYRQAERDATDREDRQNRAQGVRRVWGPRDAMLTVSLAIASVNARVRAATGRWISSGEALAIMADFFIEVWTPWVKEQQRWWSKERKEVFARTKGICAWPTCGKAAVHEHHIRPRSQGGMDEVSNLCALCAHHHLRGIHLGYLLIEGRAGECLVFRRVDGLGDVWEIVGEDDARSLG